MLLAILGMVLTALWLGVAGWYVGAYVGINNLHDFMPQEIGQLLGALMLPVVFLWLVLGYFALAMRVRQVELSVMRQPAEPRPAPDSVPAKIRKELSAGWPEAPDMLSAAVEQQPPAAAAAPGAAAATPPVRESAPPAKPEEPAMRGLAARALAAKMLKPRGDRKAAPRAPPFGRLSA